MTAAFLFSDDDPQPRKIASGEETDGLPNRPKLDPFARGRCTACRRLLPGRFAVGLCTACQLKQARQDRD